MNSKKKIISRFAPSPTGVFQLGIIRNALYIFLLVKKGGGKFILRIDDTDPRSERKYEKYIIESLKWLGLEFDEFYRQSERKEIYKKYIKKLIDGGMAYASEEGVSEESGKKKTLIRFKNPGGIIKFNDELRGCISINVSYFGDFVIARGVNDPTYHLATVVDDYEMGINYVLRGEDHIPNTPKHIMIARALGIEVPSYCHLPLLLGYDKSKLSLRSSNQMDILKYRELGYLPDALLNFVLLSGWSLQRRAKSIFSREEMMEVFNIKGLQKTNAILDIKKLDWFNRMHIKKLPIKEKIKGCIFFLPIKYKENVIPELLKRFSVFIAERINKFQDIKEMVESGDITYFFMKPPPILTSKRIRKEDLEGIMAILKSIPESEFTEIVIRERLKGLNKNNYEHPMEQFRRILSGRGKSSFDPFNIASIIGKEETLKRILDYIC